MEIAISHIKPLNESCYKAMAEVHICNIINRYKIYFSQDKNFLSGTTTVNMSDFGITPPTYMMGLVKVSNSLQVSYKLPFLKRY